MTMRVSRHPTVGGRAVYRLTLEVFPGFCGNSYLITGGRSPVLVDCGSGQAAANRQLARRFDEIAERFGERVGLSDVGSVVITHGHIDHFGGLHFVRQHTRAPVAIHADDRHILESYEERLVEAAQRVETYLATTGVSDLRRAQYMQLYLSMKTLFRSLEVDEELAAGPVEGGELTAIHVPGHCPGQICLRVDDVLLTADHVLARISPHLAPAAITAGTGMGAYLDSLIDVERLDGIELGLGGHGGPIADVAGRCREIRAHHEGRLAHVLELCAERPRTVAELSRELFGTVRSYHVLLAVLEAGAHVEYLHERGELVVESSGSVARFRRA